jgi:catechol 2,3-dioxygenase-like lactoylglutathione lyase family enzyme
MALGVSMNRLTRTGGALFAGLVVVALSHTTRAQIAAPNRSGIAMGHVHFTVRDLAANKRFWTSIGGAPANAGGTDAFSFPGLLVLLTPGTPIGDGTGEVIDHLAFRTKSLAETLARVKAAGFKVEPPGDIPNTGRAYTPDGYKIELFDAASESPRFFPDGAARDSDFERHMVTMTVPIVSQHLHYYLGEGVERDAKAWYLKMFGGTPGRRLRYEAVDLPGINLNFSISSVPNAPPAMPTRGRTLDHIGFEVRDLVSQCRTLEAAGVTLDAPCKMPRNGVATAFLTDPWGARIELTQGLREAR